MWVSLIIVVGVVAAAFAAPSNGQTSAEFGSASPQPTGLREAPMLHYGVFCIPNSGLEFSPSRVSAGMVGSYLNPNDISSDRWTALLKQYESFEKELGALGVLSAGFGLAYKQTFEASIADLKPAIKNDRDTRRLVRNLTKANALNSLKRNFQKIKVDENNNDELVQIKSDLGTSFGITSNEVTDYHLIREDIRSTYLENYSDILLSAVMSNQIAPETASHLLSRYEYLDNVRSWNLSPRQMRAQVQAELAFSLFNEGKYDRARTTAHEALQVLGGTPELYLVTDKDNEGHRRIGFSRNLAFIISKYSEFQIARAANDAAAGLQVSIELLQYAPELDHMFWYLNEERQWGAGKYTYEQLLDHFVMNLPFVLDPKLPESSLWSMRHAADAIWPDSDENKVYTTLNRNIEGKDDKVTFAISGGGGGWLRPPPAGGSVASPSPPPPRGPTFGPGAGGGRRLLLIPGADARRALLHHLRQEIDKNSTGEVALFAVLKEGESYRVIMPSARVANLKKEPEGPLQEFDTFMITGTQLTNIRTLRPDHPMSIVLAGLGGAALTMYSAPHTIIPGEFQKAADDFAFKLAGSYRDLPIFRDYFTLDTIPRSSVLISRQFGSPKNYAVLTSSKDRKIKDWGIIANLQKSYIDRYGIPVYTYNGINADELSQQLGNKDKNIILVTAHASPELQKMIYELGKAGVFKNNIVIFMSCRQQVTRDLSEFMGGQGATAVVVTDRVVQRADADYSVRTLLQNFDNPQSEKRPFRQVLFEAFRDFGGVISVSWILPHWSASNG
jgi:hypothetical protein